MRETSRLAAFFAATLTSAIALAQEGVDLPAKATSVMDPSFSLSQLFIPGIVLLCVLAGVIAISLFLRNYIKVPPNRVAVISGRSKKICGRDGAEEVVGFRMVHGGATFKLPLLEQVDYLELEVMSLSTETKNAITKEGVALTVQAIANVKIGSDDVSIRNAAERFLGKPDSELKKIISDTLEAHLRAIVCTLTVEQINNDRQRFAQQMISEAAEDLRKMGITIDVLAVQHIQDSQGYLEALGKKRTAEVKRDAAIGEAEAKRDSEIKTAEAKREATIKSTDADRLGAVAKADNEAKIAEAERNLKTKRAEYDAAVAAEQARRDQAGPKAKAEAEKAVFVAEVAAQEAKAEAETALQGKLATRKEAELQVTVIKAAEAEKKRQLIEAEGMAAAAIQQAEGEAIAAAKKAEGEKNAAIARAEATKTTLEQEGAGEASKARSIGQAEADANKAKMLAEAEGRAAQIQKVGEAEGKAIAAKLLAEAEGVKKKAEAYKQLDQAGKFMFILERAPELIESVGHAGAAILSPAFQAMGAGLANIDKVTIVETGGPSGGQSGVARFAGTAPALLFSFLQNAKAVGFDFKPLLDKLGVKSLEDLGVTLDATAHEKHPSPPATAPQSEALVPVAPPAAAPAEAPAPPAAPPPPPPVELRPAASKRPTSGR